MEKDLVKYYEIMFDLMAHEGWRVLVEEMIIEYSGLQNQLAVEEDLIKLGRLQGQLSMLKKFINFKDLAESSYETLKMNEEQADNAPL